MPKHSVEGDGPPPILPGARERLETVVRALEQHQGPHGEFDMHVEDGVASIGGWVLAAPVHEFVQVVYDLQILYPFDWSTWLDTEEGRALKDSPEALEKADLLAVRKLVTAWVRGDRFCDGILVGLAQRGELVRATRRLVTLLTSTEKRLSVQRRN